MVSPVGAWGKGELSSFLPVGRGKTPLMDWRGLGCVHDGAWHTPGIKELKEGGESRALACSGWRECVTAAHTLFFRKKLNFQMVQSKPRINLEIRFLRCTICIQK